MQASIDTGRVREETGPRASRNRLQTVTLLDAIERYELDACFGGARRDEERARAKERVLSFRDDFGSWDPRRQRPELWDLYNARVRRGENIRAFPISNWTELDVWQYIASEELELPSIYMAHEREVFARDGMLYAVSPFIELMEGEEPFTASVRYRTVGDMSCTGAVRSTASHAARRRRRDRRDEHHRARRDARRRPRVRGRDGRPQARGLLLVDLLAARHRRVSVDDGKSTLIGRLLYDAKAVLADQLAHVEERSVNGLDLALLTDGLRAEREQGITIDVAYRSFATPRRRFILADCPGHAQYTRNMVTGASTADLALLLVDARAGPDRAVRRHATIAALLRIRHVIVAVNKMDLVDFAEERFDDVVRQVLELGADGRPARDRVHPDQRAERRQRRRSLARTCPGTRARRCWSAWRRSRSSRRPCTARGCRSSSCCAARTATRWAAGRLAAGALKAGDEVVVLPSGDAHARGRGARRRRRRRGRSRRR